MAAYRQPQSSRTYGERRVEELLRELPSSEYFYVMEPKIMQAGRGSSKPDFVIMIRNKGVLVVEVKDWLEIRKGDQRSVTIIRRDGTQVKEYNPLDTARNYAYLLEKQFKEREELLERKSGKKRLKFPWQPIVILPNMPNSMVQLLVAKKIWPLGAVFGRETLHTPEAFENALSQVPWTWNLREPLTDGTWNIIRGILDPRIVIFDPKTGEYNGELTPEQEKLVTEPPDVLVSPLESRGLNLEALEIAKDQNVRLVRGVAGSGKTLVLMYRVEFVARDRPDARLLVITLNNDLTENLLRRIRNPNVEVLDFYDVCANVLGDKWHEPISASDWLWNNAKERIEAIGLNVEYVAREFRWRKEMGLTSSEDYLKASRRGRELRLTEKLRHAINDLFNDYHEFQYNQYVNNGLWLDKADVPIHAGNALQNRSHPMRHAYDMIFVDEAQDYAPTWIDVVRMLLKPSGSLFICEDPTQSLFRHYSWREKGVDVIGRSRLLKVPFRNTRQISKAAYSLITADPNLSQDHTITTPQLDSPELVDGPRPACYGCHDLDLEQAFIAGKIEKYLNDGTSPESIAILCHNRHHVRHWANHRHKNVYVDRFDNMKGKEFDVVFIPQLDRVFQHAINERAISNSRRRVFTAMTRAKTTLTLTYHEYFPEELLPIEPYVFRSIL